MMALEADHNIESRKGRRGRLYSWQTLAPEGRSIILGSAKPATRYMLVLLVGELLACFLRSHHEHTAVSPMLNQTELRTVSALFIAAFRLPTINTNTLQPSHWRHWRPGIMQYATKPGTDCGLTHNLQTGDMEGSVQLPAAGYTVLMSSALT
jgi:hypothetical protein